MLIVCPACDARYAVDDALIGPAGRAVQCSGCDAEWTVRPGETAAAARTEEARMVETATDPSRPPGPLMWVELTVDDDVALGDDRGGVAAPTTNARDHALASTLEAPPARGGGSFLAGFLLATSAALSAALVYLRADDIADAAPAVARHVEAYRVWVDALRADIAAALAAAL